MLKKPAWLLIPVLAVLLAAPQAFSEKLLIKGSTTVLPIAERIAGAYMKDYPGTRIEVSGGGSGNGIKAIIDQTTDIGNASRFIKNKELTYAQGKQIYPVPFRVAYDCIVPVVHPSSPVNDISISLLREIYMGNITNWESLGGKDRPITVVSRDTSSGTYEVWEKKVMEKSPVFPGAKVKASNADVVAEVAATPGAIGYIGLGYMDRRVKDLAVGSVPGSVSTTLDGTYPISRPLYMFTRGWPRGEALKFINYVLEPGLGQKHVSRAGFVSLYKTASPTATAEIADQEVVPETPSNVRMLQHFLNALGYPAGPVDGIKGRRTNAALVQFEKANGLPIDLRLSQSLLETLSERYVEEVKN